MAVINNLRTVFENEYPGKEKIFEELIKPIFVKAKDTTLTNQLELSEADKKQIKSFSIIAQVRGGFPITFADVELNDTVALKRSRVNIQNCVRKIMENDSNAIIFFHFADNSKEWRVSYCHRATTNKESTDAKRYTYLCGTEHSCRTIAERFATLQGLSTIKDEDMLNAFSVESLTKEFFTQIFKWYDSWACEIALFPSKNCIASQAELTAENNNLHLIRLITRIMFVWFIKQKDLIPSWVFNKAELESLLSDPDLDSEKKGNYYNAVLQNLFFGALNKKIEERSFAEKSFDGIPNEQYGIKSYFRDDNKSSFFTVSHKEMQEHFEGVPFLNGGLFECLDYDVPHGKDSHKVHYVDGFSRNAERRAFVPNALFWSEDEANLGLIPIFSRYNFTVEESTPNDVQVALDPELLGKIFENLLGTFNPETKESARKESGSFYTPREIVSYMVNTSLASYLHEKVPALSEEIIEKLTNDDKSDDEDIQLTESQIDELRKALVNIKIIDPACGSGAFPMGILNKLVEIHVLLNRLSASTHSDKNLYIKKGQFVNYTPNDELRINAEYLGEQKFKLSVNGNAENEIYTSQELAVHVKDIINKYNKKLHKNTIANLFSQGRIDDGKSFNSIKTKQEILQIVDADSKEIIWQYKTYNVENKFRKYRTEGSEQTASTETETEDGLLNYNSLYNLKTQIIQDSIFGVDIQPIAVQICKLRFFISLICEQPKTGSKENNYGYNPLPNLETKFVAANTLIGKAKKSDAMALFADQRIDNITKELLEIRKAHFSAKTAQEKKENREKDEQLRTELSKLLEEDNVYNPEDARQLAQWNPYDQTADASPFFDAEWMFGVKDGFDIVIGNPPYVRVQNIEYDMIDKLKSLYKTACKRIDISLCFIEKSKYLLHKNSGIASYIISNQFLTTEYGKAMREYLLKEYFITKCIDLGDLPIFESAMTYVSIFMFTPKKLEFMDYFPVSSMESVKKMDYGHPQKIYFNTLTSNNWNLKKSKLEVIFNKMKTNSILLESIGNCNAGLITGCDKILMFNKDELSSIDIEPDILLPVLRAENCSKYSASEPTKYVIYPYFKKEGKTYLYSESDLKKKFPKAYKYLCSNRDVLANRKDSRVTMEEKGHWYGLVRFGKKEMFDKLKIISPGEVQNHKFCLDNTKSGFSCARVFAITINSIDYDIKYVLGIMNTNIMRNFIQSIASLKNGGYYQYSSNILNRTPIPTATPEQQQPIIDIVDKILASKKADATSDTTTLERKIDEWVYKLYGLTDEEIAVVEGK